MNDYVFLQRIRIKGQTMIEFVRTLCKGIAQGFGQFINNDLKSYVPLFVVAAVLIIVVLIKNWIIKIKNRK